MYYISLLKFKFYNNTNIILKDMLFKNTDNLIKSRRTLRIIDKSNKLILKELLKYL